MTLVEDLHSKQLPKTSIEPHLYLRRSDMMRVIKRLPSTPFHPTDCCIIQVDQSTRKTKRKTTRKSHPNFWLINSKRTVKACLARVLYNNYKGELKDHHYLRRTCNQERSSICFNINHMTKHSFNNHITRPIVDKPPVTPSIPQKNLTVSFD